MLVSTPGDVMGTVVGVTSAIPCLFLEVERHLQVWTGQSGFAAESGAAAFAQLTASSPAMGYPA